MISKTKVKERMERKSNPVLIETILLLRKQKSPFWIKVAGVISRPKRKAVAVNVSKINKYTKEGDVVIVPGKVLSEGEMDHKVTLAAVSASEGAKKKIKILKISELTSKHPKGDGIKIIM
jgi:large subunit ribosomal protein L18e